MAASGRQELFFFYFDQKVEDEKLDVEIEI